MSPDDTTRAGGRALRDDVGVHRLSNRVHVDVTDRHRARFVHNMTTCDINGLSPGQGAFGLTVDRGGKMVGQFFAEVDGETTRVELDAGCRDDVVGHWTSHRIADMVRFASNDGLAVVAVVGPRAGALLDRLLALDQLVKSWAPVARPAQPKEDA